jgi:hypothetical protein
MYHLEVTTFSRCQNKPGLTSSGSRRLVKSIVGPAAYRSAERLYDERNKRFYDYRSKNGIVHTEILLPPNAPLKFSDRATLWNSVEKAENRKDSRLARQIIIALPRELTLVEQIERARYFILGHCVCRGMISDLCIHEEGHYRGDKNPHAHILLTDRPVNAEGFLPHKDTSWNDRQLIVEWREAWANTLNVAYERKGLEKRVTHESFKTLGITDRKPTKHLGSRVLEYAERGQMTDRFLEHLRILRSDQERERLMLRSLEQVRNPRDREQLMAQFLEIAANTHMEGRLTSRLIEILERNHERERQRNRSPERSR